MSVVISDFLTEENYEDGLSYLIDKRRHVFCLQVLAKEEINPLTRGKVHFFDSEDVNKTYRKHIDKEIAEAYKKAFKYVTERISNFCNSRNADYMLVSAEDSLGEVFLGKMVDKGVLK